MDIKDRIKLIMENENLTAAAFAESIGVAQATISHTLGDRNKYPSTDFIMRLHERYDYINLDWLLTGKGSMTEDPNLKINESSNLGKVENDSEDYPLFSSNHQTKLTNNENDVNNRSETTSLNNDKEQKPTVIQEIVYKEAPSRTITEIRIFFDDNTYEIFKPEK